LVLKDDTPDLLLTWLDKQGDFHVVQKPADVPSDARTQVRVVVTTLEAGTNELVYVADLGAPAADGSYPTRTMSRSEWNNLGADRRKVRLEALAPEVQTASPAHPAEADDSANTGKPTAGSQAKADYSKVRVIIYGAEWCKPCHDAEKFLRSLGADVTKKDIEESRSAQAEMQQKLAQAGRMGSSIPVIDVAGKLLIGFSEDALRSALKAATKAETL
jgi:glutaredoxin